MLNSQYIIESLNIDTFFNEDLNMNLSHWVTLLCKFVYVKLASENLGYILVRKEEKQMEMKM